VRPGLTANLAPAPRIFAACGDVGEENRAGTPANINADAPAAQAPGRRPGQLAYLTRCRNSAGQDPLRLDLLRMSAAQIGTTPGETLEGLIVCALRDGVDRVYQMGFTDDGQLAARVHE
jgi:hypothetical protein